MFSSIWNETSVSGNRLSRACPSDTPRKAAISRASSGWALPENTFSSPNPTAMYGSLNIACRLPARASGWGGRIRTSEYGIQSPAPYRLATPQRFVRLVNDLLSGLNDAVQTSSVADRLTWRQVADMRDGSASASQTCAAPPAAG